MPVLFEKIAAVILPHRRALVIGALVMFASLPITFVADLADYGVYLLPALMVLWGLVVMSVWFDPASGFLSKGQPRWKRMLAWPAAIGLDLWFAIIGASFARFEPLSVIP
jgi:hypothetical protein